MITELTLEPAEGSFDIDRVIAHLRDAPHTHPDLVLPNKFLMFADADAARRGLEEREARGSLPYSAVLVKVNPHKIGISCMSSNAGRAKEFVAWLATIYRLRYFDEDRNDLGAYVAQDPGFLYGGA